MATKIVTKNSSTASAVPTASDLVQGELAVNVADKRLFTEDNAGAIVELGTNPSGNVTFQDNGKAIFGAGSDLQIYHDGSNSRIHDAGTGVLLLQTDGTGVQIKSDGSESIADFNKNGGVNLYYDNAAKLATTSTGIDVTGNMISDGVGIGTSSPSAKIHATTATAGYAAKLINTNGASDANGLLIQAGTVSSEYALNVTNTAGTTNFMVVKGDGSVGIGTSSPNAVADLHVADTSDARIWLDATSADTMELYSGTGVGMFNRSNSYLMLGTNNTERMRIDSSGNVGVGTSTDTGKLNIYRSGGETQVKIRSDSDQAGNIYFTDATSGYSGSLAYVHTDNSMRFATNGTGEKMRIDSSGHLLVGSTNASSSVAGFRAYSGGNGAFTVAGQPLELNRLSSDGSILGFQRDGTTVGSIGTLNADPWMARANGCGVRFITAAWLPTNNTGNDSDNTVDLGMSSARFKDLYLSGGVYLGGTGAANKLDDYEEGTWTPAITEAGTDRSPSYGVGQQGGKYTKIGNRVFCVFGFLLTNKGSGSGSGQVQIGGLPFSVVSPASYQEPTFSMFSGGFTTATTTNANVQVFSGDRMRLWQSNNTAPGATAVPYTEITNNTFINVSVSYDTA